MIARIRGEDPDKTVSCDDGAAAARKCGGTRKLPVVIGFRAPLSLRFDGMTSPSMLFGMRTKRSERLFIYIEPERKARIVSAALRSELSVSEFMAEATEKVMDKADGVRDELAPFVLALEEMRENLRYDLRSHANQNIEENRVMRKQVREFIENNELAMQAFQTMLLERQAKAIQIAVAHAVEAVAGQKQAKP